MSQFLPESAAPVPGAADVAPKGKEQGAQVTAEDVALMMRVLNAAAQNPTMIPDALMSYVQDWLQVSNLNIGISQVFGFSQFTVKTKASSSSFGSITATGPGTGLPSADFTLDSLPDGRYAFLFGATVDISGPAAGGQIATRIYPNKTGPNTSQNAVTVAQTFGLFQRQWDGSTPVTGDLSVQLTGIHIADLTNVKSAATNNTMTMEAWLNSGSPTNIIQNPFILGFLYGHL